MNARRVLGGWFGLIVLYTALTQSEKVAALLGTTTAATRRLSDPNVPLIPDKAGASSKTTTSTTTPTGPALTGQNIAPGTVIPPGQILHAQ